MNCFHVQLPPVAPDDPFLQQKRDILAQKALTLHFLVPANESRDCELHLNAMLKAARVLNLNEIEWYFLEEDDLGPINFRNELEALNTILAALECVASTYKDNPSFHILVEMVKQKLGLLHTDEIVEANNPCVGDKERRFLDWAQREGIETKLDVAAFGDVGRGGRAAIDIGVNDIVLKVPQHLIICEDFVLNTDMDLPLKDFELSGETKVLLWSMRERHDPSSKFAPYFACLPVSFNTGLSFGLSALKALDGTMVFEELIQAKEHLRSEYEGLFPTLSHRYPTVFPQEKFTWDMFLWACELWYSNGLKIAYPDGTIKTCLVPFVGLLNHSLYPHVTHYSKIDTKSKTLVLHSARPCNAGQQCLLSYGALSNSHLLMFYGFILSNKNPFDVVPIDLDLSDSPDRLALIERLNLGLSHMIRGSWLNPFQIPTRLIATLCIAFMDEDEARALPLMPKYEKMSLDSKRKAYEFVSSLLSSMLDQLGDFVSTKDIDECAWDVKLATLFKNQQRTLLESASDCCYLLKSAFFEPDEQHKDLFSCNCPSSLSLETFLGSISSYIGATSSPSFEFKASSNKET
ncbi:hypothetical protein GOP47_0002750 [Adiantum capillus-veneris]|uniref:Rubisco LSMT substrate-binding domain-containing protein n=1 Tax=Adiantum capillus-veneris TaxID=13818 RepID=A0A9D4VCN7_ADICA|nr:hypothetical protein GOP47_0002750 [Adiantum capillus-veneris]